MPTDKKSLTTVFPRVSVPDPSGEIQELMQLPRGQYWIRVERYQELGLEPGVGIRKPELKSGVGQSLYEVSDDTAETLMKCDNFVEFTPFDDPKHPNFEQSLKRVWVNRTLVQNPDTITDLTGNGQVVAIPLNIDRWRLVKEPLTVVRKKLGLE